MYAGETIASILQGLLSELSDTVSQTSHCAGHIINPQEMLDVIMNTVFRTAAIKR